MKRIALALAVLGLISTSRLTHAVTPITYSTTFSGADGALKSASFTGTLNMTSLTGDLDVAGNAYAISGVVGADGSVTGTVTLKGGLAVGSFSAQRTGTNMLSIKYNAAGMAGTVTTPTPNGLNF